MPASSGVSAAATGCWWTDCTTSALSPFSVIRVAAKSLFLGNCDGRVETAGRYAVVWRGKGEEGANGSLGLIMSSFVELPF